MKIHSDLTLMRSSQFSLFEQWENIGADIEQAIRWINNRIYTAVLEKVR